MKNNQVTKFLILFVFVFLCSCDLFKSMCEAEKPPKQSTTLQQIVNDTNAGETIDLEKYSNEYDITDYNAEISKNLTIKNGSFQNTTLKIKAEVKLEKVQELSVETSANLTIRDSKLNNLLLGTNAESRSTNSGNTNFDLKVIVKNCEIAEKIKINSKAKLNIAGEKTKIAKIVVAVAAEVCKILCTTEVDTKKIENVITDENGEKPEEIKITQAYKITYHSNCDELEDIEDFFSPDDETISLPTDIFKRNGYIFAGWYYDNNQAVEDSINVSDKTENIDVYAKWEPENEGKIAGEYKLLNESAIIKIENDGKFVVTVTISSPADDYMKGTWTKTSETEYSFTFDDGTTGTATSIEEDVIKMVYLNEAKEMNINSYAVKTSDEDVDLSETWTDGSSKIIIRGSTFTAIMEDGSVIKNGNVEKTGNFFKLQELAFGAISTSKQVLYIDPYGKEITPSIYKILVDTTVYVEFPTEAKVSTNGVYTAKLVKEGVDLSGGFGSVAGEKETIKVVLAPKDVVAKVIDGTITSAADLFVDENKCYIYPNNDVGNGMFTSATVVEGTYVQPAAGYSHYEGLAITKDADGNYIVKFDVSKIDNAILLAKGTPKGTLGEYGESKVDAETDAWNAVDTLKTNYIPMVLGSVTGNSGAAYPFNFWNAGIAIMEPTTEDYPTNVIYEQPLSYNFNHLNSYCGTMSKWVHNSLEANSFIFTAAGGDEFAFTIGSFNFKANGVEITELDMEFALKEGAVDNITFADGVLTEGTNYIVTLIVKGDKEAYVKVSEAKNEVTITDDNNNTETINFSELSTKLSTLSAGTYTLKVSGGITNTTITEIANAMNSNTEAKINLDLSGANGVTTIGDNAFSDCSGLTSVTIPNSVTTIGDYAFYYCSSLTSVTIGNGVTSIGDQAFQYCSNLTDVTIPGNVTTIGDYAFEACSNLASVTIGNGVTTIGVSAFYYCENLTSVTIPDSVESIGSFSFVGCNNLTTFEVGTNNSNFSSSNDKHILFNKDKTVLIAYPSAKDDVTTILDSDNVTTIGDYAFSSCSSLTSIKIPDGITSIGSSAFSDCSKLTSIEIPNSVTSIGDYAFSGCSGLTSIEIPNSVTTIDQYTFYECSSLTSVTIPNSVTTIGDQAFYDCSSLKSIEIPDSVESIGSFSFVGCNNLTTFEIGTNNSNFSSSNDKLILFNKYKTELIAYPSATGDITTIPDSDSVTTIKSGAFEDCSGLTSLTIPDSVITIEYRAIPDCINLKTVIIGSGVKNIYNNVFEGCSNLEDVTFRDTNNWYYTSNSDFTSGEEIVVTDTKQNSTKLKENDKYWYKSSTGGTAN